MLRFQRSYLQDKIAHFATDPSFSSLTGNTPGYWEPHTSSINFCEPDYHLLKFVAEFHNSWSSLFFTYVGLMGYLHGNPTKEFRVSLLFIILMIIGFGSTALHTSLHWLWQSTDEVPMLWMTLSLLYFLNTIRREPGSALDKRSALCFLLLGLFQTIIYYTNRNVYVYFLASFVSYVAVILGWSVQLLKDEHLDEIHHIKKVLFKGAFTYFILVGSAFWMLEVHFCQSLLPYYFKIFGFSFHVLWHLGAAMGCYFMITYLIAVRLQILKKNFQVQWLHGFLPICRLLSEDNDSTRSLYGGSPIRMGVVRAKIAIKSLF